MDTQNTNPTTPRRAATDMIELCGSRAITPSLVPKFISGVP